MRVAIQAFVGAALIASVSLPITSSVSAMPTIGAVPAAQAATGGVVPAFYRCGYYGCHHVYRRYYRPYRYYGGYYRPYYYGPHIGIGLGGFGIY